MTQPPPSKLDELAAGRLVRARPFDVIGAALGAPMIIWGLLAWFGTAGDAGGDVAGYYSGGGAASIALVLAASAYALNQILSGRAHETQGPPVSVLLAGAATILVLGSMIAKPDSATVEAGSVIGLLTAAAQTAALTVGWISGSGKTVKASKIQALQARQDAADRIGTYGQAGQYGQGQYGRPAYAPSWQGQGQYGQPAYAPNWPGQQAPQNQQLQQGQPPFGAAPYGQVPYGADPYGQRYGQRPPGPGGIPGQPSYPPYQGPYGQPAYPPVPAEPPRD